MGCLCMGVGRAADDRREKADTIVRACCGLAWVGVEQEEAWWDGTPHSKHDRAVWMAKIRWKILLLGVLP